MCGISAVFSENKQALANIVHKMNKLVEHRGPDSVGMLCLTTCSGGKLEQTFEEISEASLGHTRLSIVDLSDSGRQPMFSCDQRYVITYNGEIYNHKDLRDELKSLGCKFRSRTDTEVILAAYSMWGENCLRRFNGMFSFVLVDCYTRQVFVARDRFGIKPLYVYRSVEGFIGFSSEIKQFTSFPDWTAKLNAQMGYDFLNWGVSDHTSETLFEGVTQLRGGECAVFSLDNIPRELSVRRWYDIGKFSFDGDMTSAADHLANLLEDSIKLRLQADVPVGSCLSGGLDSSSIVCISNQVLNGSGFTGRQHTFSARSTESAYDEGKFISSVVKKTNVIEHNVVPKLDELFSTLPSLIWHNDEPFGSTSVYAQWNVFKLAKDAAIKVMLDGQGADELFAGYHGYFGSYLTGLLAAGRFKNFFWEMQNICSVHRYSYFHLFKLMANQSLPPRLRQNFRALAGKSSIHNTSWFNGEKFELDYRDPNDVYNNVPRSLRELGRDHVLRTHLPMLLHWEDRNSMAHSVEARVPFLDYRLVEFAFSLSDDLKIRKGMTKAVLRHAMAGVLPEKVRNRIDKLGFVTPEEIWMRYHSPDSFLRAIRRAVEQSNGVLNGEAIRLLEDVIDGKRPFTFLPWRMISFGAWMEVFNVSAG
ncbi:MAG: asparagine synthase (glutamine-hydrolyzing) [Rhodospirillales bacterium]|nr:asparagine synthase (glutamine-hydrolyzing) [Rhodospirillales bacterium]